MLIIFTITLLVVITNTKAMIDDYNKIAKSDNVGVYLYAKKINGLYTDFIIDFQGHILLKPYWINTTNPTWAPKIIYEDISQDGRKELVIILTKGTGTGVLNREVHIFQIQQQKINNKQDVVPVEVLIDDPIEIILKNVKTGLTSSMANIIIGEKKYDIDIQNFGIQPEHLFDDIFFGNIINFEIKNSQLIAMIGGQISPAGGYIGDIEITYKFKDKMYQANSIKFISSK